MGRDTEVISTLERIYDEAAKDDSAALLIASSLFVAVLGFLSRLAITALPKSTEADALYVLVKDLIC